MESGGGCRPRGINALTCDYCETPFETIFYRPNDKQAQLRQHGSKKINIECKKPQD